KRDWSSDVCSSDLQWVVGGGRLPPPTSAVPPPRRSLDHTKEVIVMESSSWSRTVTIAAVLMLAGIAVVVSYSHMYELALRHGEPEWRAALFPLSVDGMIGAPRGAVGSSGDERPAPWGCRSSPMKLGAA